MSKNKEEDLTLAVLISGGIYNEIYSSNKNLRVDWDGVSLETFLKGDLDTELLNTSDNEVIIIEAKYRKASVQTYEGEGATVDSETIVCYDLWVKDAYLLRSNKPLLVQVISNKLTKIISNMNKAPNE